MQTASIEPGTVERLLAELGSAGHWRGRLSSSALSTATAICALELVRRADAPSEKELATAVNGGALWLARYRNRDGGWGDTTDSPSNVSTTILVWAALGLVDARDEAPSDAKATEVAEAREAASAWLRREAGELTAANLARVLLERYGDDRTFSVPILTLCALAGRFGSGPQAWEEIPPMPFEVAALPRASFRLVGLPMVSYALPALIAMGQARHHNGPPPGPIARAARAATRRRTLAVLRAIQPDNGGFLEATPLTSFVTMSLVSLGSAALGTDGREVVARGVGFLLRSRRDDGSWPIDTDLATWVSTQAIDALATSGRLTVATEPDPTANRAPAASLDAPSLGTLGRWLLDQQYRDAHPYTGAPPGGWAWTDLPGGVPDADDTAGALVALRHLLDAGAVEPSEARSAARAGVEWLLGLQNRDGGIPTFCRGWGKLPFDRSGADLTAHALRAWRSWRSDLDGRLGRRVDLAVAEALHFLVRAQRADGAWVPLWFGNQAEPRQENPLYGTARVLQAVGVEPAQRNLADNWQAARARAVAWLLAAEHAGGGWGAAAGIAPTVEETGLAVLALATYVRADEAGAAATRGAVERGRSWLARHSSDDIQPAPIGLYFAKLWYSERLYPLIFATAAEAPVERALHARASRR